MDAIESLKELDPWAMFCGVIVVLIAWSFLQGLWEKTIGKLLKKVDLETKAMRQKREDKEKLDAVVELAKKTAENLDKLQQRHTKDEETFRKSLNDYMEESRKDRKELHDEMSKFTSNRVSDRQQSIQIQKELSDSIKDLIDRQGNRDEQIVALMCGTKELLGSTIDELYEKYINLKGIPQNEVDEFDSIYSAYRGLNGNHGRQTKYEYVKNHLPVIPVKTELVMSHE